MELGLIAGLWVGGSTIFGALLTSVRDRLPGTNKLPNMDFALGMMLSASAFSLILPAAQNSLALGSHAFLITISMVFIGAASMRTLAHFMKTYSAATLFVFAMMLHNFPEGLAAGAASSGLSQLGSTSLITAIMLQNIPEGFATVIAFRSLGLSNRFALLGAILSGVVEIAGGSLGGVFVQQTHSALPAVLALAGGAMLQVTLRELIERFKSEIPVLYSRLGSGFAAIFLLSWLGN